MSTDHRLRNFKFLNLLGAMLFLLVPLAAQGAAGVYPGSGFFNTTPSEWEVSITIDEVSGLVVPLVDVFVSSSDETETLIQGQAELGPGTTPARDAQLNPIDTAPSLGRARVTSDLETIGDASGMFTANDGERIRIRSSSSLLFNLEFTGASDTPESTAIVCLMPIQLAVVEGGTGTPFGSAEYAFALEVDGVEIFTSSMRLSGTAASVQLTSLSGEVRTDGVFFEDATYNTFGINFPARTWAMPMGAFNAGEILEAQISFATTIEAPDNNWGGYAGPTNATVDPNIFIPVPEPQVAGFLLAGLLVLLRRRVRRSAS